MRETFANGILRWPDGLGCVEKEIGARDSTGQFCPGDAFLARLAAGVVLALLLAVCVMGQAVGRCHLLGK